MPLVKPHWSIRYFLDRSKVRYWEGKHSGKPWFTRQAVELLSDWIKPTDKALEYGFGRSTTWLVNQVKPGGILVYDDCQVHSDATNRVPSRHRAFQPLHARTAEYGAAWQPVYDLLADWRLIWTTDGTKDTSIWVRPTA